MNDLKEASSNDPSSQFVINVKQGDRPPVAWIKPITLLKRQGDDPSALRGREKTRIKTRVKDRDKIRAKDILKFNIELHG